MAATEFIATNLGTLPSANYVAVSPNDSTDLSYYTRGVYVGGAGNMVVTTLPSSAGGTAADVTFSGLPAGIILPIRVARVKNTNTTATNIVALY